MLPMLGCECTYSPLIVLLRWLSYMGVGKHRSFLTMRNFINSCFETFGHDHATIIVKTVTIQYGLIRTDNEIEIG